MSFTPYNAPILSGLFGDKEIAGLFSVKSDIDAMLRFESALATAEAKCGAIPGESALVISEACKSFSPDLPSLATAVARDGLAVPELVQQLRQQIGKPHGDFVHFGATSQDVVDTSLIIRLCEVVEVYQSRISVTVRQLGELGDRFGNLPMMGRTRMQAALQIKTADRIKIWKSPLEAHLVKLSTLRSNVLQLQFGGAVGTLDKLGENSQAVASALANELGLTDPKNQWHTDRSAIAELCNWLSLVTGTLGKMGQDFTLMAQQGVAEVTFSDNGGSSAMPHKQNPVKAEALVTLARFNAVQLSGIHQALIHEQERSGSAWSLEWMIVPQMCVATGAALNLAIALTNSVTQMGITDS